MAADEAPAVAAGVTATAVGGACVGGVGLAAGAAHDTSSAARSASAITTNTKGRATGRVALRNLPL